MAMFNVSTDIIPIGELKKKLSRYLTEVQLSGHPFIITQNGKPSAVLMSPAEYDQLVYEKSFLESIHRGLSDIESGNMYGKTELSEELQKRRVSRKF